MLSELCAELHNYFCSDADKHFGQFKVSGGVIAPLDFLLEGQYFRIVGSVFNDGVHQYPPADLADETFTGAIWAMKVPADVVKLSDDIKAYVESDAGKPSPFVSESFGGYSYSKATEKGGGPVGWTSVFGKRLARYRKVRV